MEEEVETKKSSRFFGIIMTMFVLSVIISGLDSSLNLLHYYKQNQNSAEIVLTEIKLDFEVSLSDYMGVCYSDSLLAGAEIYVVDSIEEDVGGRFYQDPVTIVLVDTDVNTVSHEASHLVDYIISRKGIHDGETRAYLQGYFTECIYNKVN